ncbi:MAG: FAD-dependent oxidoreductase [Treponema sp.]|jgi:fumarate reductase flavoprotein subunit|nr:FAD-dependent oxidoreductase [Treponema sp.]
MKNHWKLAAGLMVLFFSLVLWAFTGCPQAEDVTVDKMNPGTYSGTGNGFEGEFTVWVTVGEYTITNIKVDDAHESAQVGLAAIPILVNRILEAQTSEVDGVSGATFTSDALKSAVKTALEKAGASSVFTSAPATPEKRAKAVTTDVLVIGSGAAGLSAAIEAAQVEVGNNWGSPIYASVTLIEKEEIIGGSTKLSAGLIYAAVDTADEDTLKDYFLYRAQGYADSTLLDFYAKNSLATLNFVGTDNIMMTMAAGMSSTPRSRMVTGMGPGLMSILEEKAKTAGVTILTGVKAAKLEKNSNGAVVRVLANSKTYNYTFNVNKGVVIATGGFDSDHAGLMAQYNKDSQYDSPRSSHGNVGEGIKMGVEAGAATVFKGGKIGWGIISPSVNVDIMAGADIISDKGDFLDLSAPSAGTAADGTSLAAVDWYDARFNGYVSSPYPGVPDSRQEPGSDYPPMYTGLQRARAAGASRFWQISNTPFGASSLTSGGPTHNGLEAGGLAYSADSVAALAAKIDVDATKLADRFNDRGWSAATKFYAWQIMPSSIGSMGGLKINVDSQVLSTTGAVIPGLYAAGEVANGDFYYQQYPASGSSLSLAITFGRVAGQKAAAESNHTLLP